MGYEITLRDRTIEFIDDADAFAHEKSMTTFYRTANGRNTVDCWATPLASVRTDEVLMIRQANAPRVAVSGAPTAEVPTFAFDEVDEVVATVHHLVGA